MIIYSVSKSKFVVSQGPEKGLEQTTLSGTVLGVRFFDQELDGRVVNTAELKFTGIDSDFILNLKTDSGYFRSLCNLLRSGKLDLPVIITPLFKQNDHGRTQTGFSVAQNETTLRPFFAKEVIETGLCELPKAGLIEKDGSSKPDFSKQNNYWITWLASCFKLSAIELHQAEKGTMPNEEKTEPIQRTKARRNYNWPIILFPVILVAAVLVFLFNKYTNTKTAEKNMLPDTSAQAVAVVDTAVSPVIDPQKQVTDLLDRVLDICGTREFSGLSYSGSTTNNSNIFLSRGVPPIIEFTNYTSDRQITESGYLTNMVVQQGGNYGTKLIKGRWTNLKYSSISGNFELSVMNNEEMNMIYVGIVGDGNWTCYANFQLEDLSFKKLVDLLGGIYTPSASKMTETIIIKKKPLVLNFLRNYYSSFGSPEFDASDYFSSEISQFINAKNITPAQLNMILSESNDYIDGQTEIIDNEIYYKRSDFGIEYWEFWAKYSCFRPSKNKYQNCIVHVEIGIDNATKLNSYKELGIENLIYSDER